MYRGIFVLAQGRGRRGIRHAPLCCYIVNSYTAWCEVLTGHCLRMLWVTSALANRLGIWTRYQMEKNGLCIDGLLDERYCGNVS